MTNSVGALWVATDRETGEVKKDKHGNSWFTGSLEINGAKYPVVAFINKPKEKQTQPDIKIYMKEERSKGNPDRADGGFRDDIPF